MLGPKKGFVLLFSLTVAFVFIPCMAAGADTCDLVDSRAGLCTSAQINGDGVDVSATQGTPGNGSGQQNGGASGTTQPPPPPPSLPGGTPAVPGFSPGRDGFTITSPVILADLVNFKPAPGVDHMEPNGWMIVGLDTNFYATVQSPVQSGLLLGQQASVRFTPVRYHWSYGDGKAANLGTKGATWAAQGIHEFERTPTSHIYSKPGSYDIDLSIDFAAEYRYAGGDWVPVAGTLPVPANRLHATAGDAKTVLVERDCSVSPRGPGC
jgi:hypothetical protein